MKELLLLHGRRITMLYNGGGGVGARARVGLREKKCDLLPPLLHAYDERDGPAEITRFGPVITGGKQRVLYDHGNLPCAAAVTVVKREITSQMTCSTCVALT